MPLRIYRRAKKAGLSPGSLVYVGEKRVEKVRIRLFDYDDKQYKEKELKHIDDAFRYTDANTVTWINIDGLQDVQILQKIGDHFHIHPLVLEDILNTGQRPKAEDYPRYLFAVLKMLSFNEETEEINSEQISIILGSQFVISFQETEGDVFDVIRERIRNNESRLRQNGAAYLFYRLLDTIVDNYFVTLEKIGENIEDLEEWLVEDPSREIIPAIHKLKRELIFLRRSVWPLRELISGLQRFESAMVKDEIHVFLRDVYDHTIQVIDTVESYRDMVSGMIDIYLSSQSNRMNEVMKTLTIMASIFIPLTFIVGIYGMNFDTEISPLNMPELHWYYGYPVTLFVMAAIAVFMIFYFKRKKWF